MLITILSSSYSWKFFQQLAMRRLREWKGKTKWVMPPLPLVLSAIARTSPKARTLLHKRHGHFHLIHPSFVPQEGISVVSYLNRRSLDIFTWQLCRQAQGVACGLRPHVFMPERRTAAAPCRAAGEGPRRTEQADEVLHLSALWRGGPSRISRIS